MNGIQNFALTVLGASATTAVLLGGLVWLFRSWISQRLRSSIQHEYDVRLASLNSTLKEQTDAAAARLKAAFDRESEKLRLTSQSFSEVQKAAISKRLTAIERTWLSTLQLSNSVPPAVSFLDLLTTQEILEAHQIESYSRDLASLNHYKVNLPLMESTKKLAEDRPYIGEYLWALFGVYQAISLRANYLVDRSKEDPQKRNWSRDKLVRQHIGSALGQDDLAIFDALVSGKSMWVHDRFSRAILKAMEKIIEGSAFGDAALVQAEEMETRIQQSSFESKKAQLQD